MRYEIVLPDYQEAKGEKRLYFWSGIPYWMVTSGSCDHIFNLIEEGYDLEKISIKLSVPLNKLMEFLVPLMNVGIIYPEHRAPKMPSIHDLDFAESVPITNLVFYLTERCNLRCIHCYNGDFRPREDEVTTEEIKEVLEDAKPLLNPRWPQTGVLGGEPLLREEALLETMDYAHQLGYRISTSTNGTLVSREFARKACDIGLNVQVSLDGATEETNDRIRGHGTFRKAIHAIEILLEEGCEVATNFVYHRMNISELPKYIEMMDKMGVHHIRFIQMKLVGRSLKNQLRSIPFDEAFELLFPLLKDNPKLQAKCVDSTIGSLAVLIRLCPKYRSCGLGRSATMIHSNGDVYSCASTAGHPQFKAGNIREEKFSEIWRNSSVLKKLWEETNIDTLNPRCACCKIRYMCAGGCRGESWREYGALNQPAVNCHDIQRSTFKIMWMLAEAPDYFRNYAEWMMTKIPPAQTRDLLPPCIIPLTPCT